MPIKRTRLKGTAAHMVGTRKTKILLVDDDKIIVEDLKRTLLQNGYNASCTLTGNEALNMVEREHFDIVITDMRMPDSLVVHLKCSLFSSQLKKLPLLPRPY